MDGGTDRHVARSRPKFPFQKLLPDNLREMRWGNREKEKQDQAAFAGAEVASQLTADRKGRKTETTVP